MTQVQIEERIYFNLKLIHILNQIRVLCHDAACLQQHLENLENGTLTDVDLYKLLEDRKECQK